MKYFASSAAFIVLTAAVLAFVGGSSTYASANDGDDHHQQQEEERELVSLKKGGGNVNKQCATRLNKCQAKASMGSRTIAQWTDQLVNNAAAMNNQNVQKFAGLLSEQQKAATTTTTKDAFAQWAANAKNNKNAVKSLVNQLGKIRPNENNLESTAVATQKIIGDFTASGAGAAVATTAKQLPNPLDLLVQIITFVVNLLGDIIQAPIKLITTIIQAIIGFLFGNARDMATLASVPTADVNCFAAVMECEYNELMETVIPATFGAAYFSEE